MTECFKCGVEDDKTILYDVITKEGIKQVCRSCLEEEELPVIKKPTEFQLKKLEPESKNNVYQRLSNMSGVRNLKGTGVQVKSQDIYNPQQEDLRRLSREVAKKTFQKEENPEGLVEHFHWTILRGRRAKKMSQKQLADEVRENEETIKILERGVLPRGYLEIVERIERVLDVTLLERTFRDKMNVKRPVSLNFDKRNFDNIKLADLQEMQRKKDEEVEIESPEEKKEIKGDDDDISQEEINRIIFGKK